MPNHIYVGIDSCRKGWCYTSSTDRSGCETGVVPDIARIWRNFDKAALILIDIPIGLPSITHKKEARDIGKKVNDFSEKGQALPFTGISMLAFSDQLSASFCHIANHHPPNNDHLSFG